MSGLPALERAFQTARVWLKEVAAELQWKDERRVYAALRTVLHALRDRLTLAESVQFGAQLPTFVRGLYYEGWRPGVSTMRGRTKEVFLEEIRETFFETRMPKVDPEFVAKAIFRFLDDKISEGELSDVRGQLPKGIRALWPGPAPVILPANIAGGRKRATA